MCVLCQIVYRGLDKVPRKRLASLMANIDQLVREYARSGDGGLLWCVHKQAPSAVQISTQYRIEATSAATIKMSI